MIIDTHAHLFNKYYDNLDEIIKQNENLVIINIGTSKEDSKEVIQTCEKYANVFGTLGIHPSEKKDWTEEFKAFLEKNTKNKKIVAIGEIGLDYHYNEEKELQKKVFKDQLELARKLSMPVVIHSRDAYEETLEILKEYKDLVKIMHCFSYDKKAASEFLKIGCIFSVNGIITFKNSKNIQEVIKYVGLDNLILETDSPYLTPEPYRGRKNDVSNIWIIAEEVARILNVDKKEVIEKTTFNAISKFDLKI